MQQLLSTSNGQNDNKLFKNNKQLINIVDLLGRDSEGLKNQPLFISMMMELLIRK